MSQRPGGPGLYLATHVKRFISEVQNSPDNESCLRLAIRTLVEFREDRLTSLRSTAPGAVHQIYFQGDHPDTLTRFQNHPLNAIDKLFSWPACLQAFRGDWVDAGMIYRQFVVDSSEAIHRTTGNPVRFRDLGPTQMPEAFKHLLANIGVSEVVPPAGNGPDTPIDLNYIPNVKNYMDWLRENWQAYSGPFVTEGIPWLAFVYPEGMQRIYPEPSPIPGKSAGVSQWNQPARTNLLEFFESLRTTNSSPGWEGNVLTILNRDTGTWDEEHDFSAQFGYPHSSTAVVSGHRETGLPLRRLSNSKTLISHARQFGALSSLKTPAWENMHVLLNQSLADFISVGNETQVDWYWISGQCSAGKPDYSAWLQSTPGSAFNVGGGSAWNQNFQNMLDTFLHDPVDKVHPLQSPHFFFSTERFNEITLKNNASRGHRRTYPVSAIEGAGSTLKNLVMHGEPLTLTSYIFHDFTFFTGDATTFAKFWGLPYHPTNPGAVDEQLYFDQTTASERNKGTLESLYNLAVLILDAGAMPSIGVEVSGAVQFEIDAGSDQMLASSDDRLSTRFSNKLATYADDLAKNNDTSNAQLGLRKLLRTRSRFRQFLIGGRRVRDPRISDPIIGGQAHWWASDMGIIRWSKADMKVDKVKEFMFGPNPSNQIKLNRLVIGSYAVEDVNPIENHRALVGVYYPAIDPTTSPPLAYHLQIDFDDWPLDIQQSYQVELLNESGALVLQFGQTTPGSNSFAITTPANQYLQPGEIHLWIFKGP